MTTCNEKLCEECSLPLPFGRGQNRRTLHEECKGLDVNLPRRCKKCRKVKVASAFSRDSSRAEGRFPYCKTCQVANVSKFQNPEDELNGHFCPVDDAPIRGAKNRRFCSESCKAKTASLRKKYGMDIADWRRLVTDTGGLCPVCKQRSTVWQVDHNHTTGMSTGVVCITCNVGLLAYSGHSTDRAQALVDYLTETPCQRLGIEAKAPDTPPGNRTSNLHNVWGRNRYQAKGTLGRNQFS